MISRYYIIAIILLLPILAKGQVLLKTYYDEDKSVIKEEFYVKSRQDNILHGLYKAYYIDGVTKSEGRFANNKSTGVWKYYYKNGRLRMQGEIDDGKNIGKWDYFFENGSTKMSGRLLSGKKEGIWVYFYKNNSKESEGSYASGLKIGSWKYFHESGVVKANEEFSGEGSYYEEVYETGSIKSEGKILNGEKVDRWLFYYEDGTLHTEGHYLANKKTGNWKYYSETGKIDAEGEYVNDLANGVWIYYFYDGTVSSQGELVEGSRDGRWKMFYNDGTLKGEANYNRGDGEYKEYHKNGAIKVKGMVKSGANNGLWQYYYENGNLEGTCDFVMGEGMYKGFYNDGELKMQGQIKDDIKTGIWELYEKSGVITGYYKPYYEEGEETFFLADEMKEQKELSQIRRASAGSSKKLKRKSRYFKKKIREYKAFIIGYNPIAPLVGSLPFSFEYYMEERLGYELATQYIRRPFFRSFSSVDPGETYSEGFAVSLRQKFYHQEVPMGQPYFAHEVKYTSLSYGTNVANEQIMGASEQKIEYALIVGNRYFKNVTSNGFTIDTYIGIGAGYREYNQIYSTADPIDDPFQSLNQNNFAYSIRIGINLGFAFRIRR